ncbi:GMC family oxidoreductase [Flavisphingomonas formosensis]|uniref:GMC family oxidoreductase n=1 Tax=Flavisphingomonas formosensis TaxID=861534 RepID=UPI0018DFA419|nr:GMC family oxidoreductase N-terminal domain-containing protein [Sphingomonas formosensis]
METFDYIIVGAGSAGCVLADRLSRDPANRVLLLEAGGEDRSYLIGVPKGFSKLVLDPAHAWHYAVGQPRGNGVDVKESWVRGRGLGGSSSINGMIYVRGQPEDYEEWARRAGPEWSWDAMKQAFRAIEDHELGDDGVRGVGGPVGISVGHFRYPLAERLIAAGEQMGLARKDDLNREDQEGVGYFSHNIKGGRRQSASRTFLKAARGRPNLTVRTGVMVDRIAFDARRAARVACRIGERRVRFAASREIVVSASALQSPKLLQLSGIGPGALLRHHGIPVVHDSPDVGGHLLEHLGFTLTHRLKGGERGLNHRFRGLGLAGSILQYLAFHSGPLSSGPLEVGAFVKVDPAATRPDVQLYLGGATMVRPEGENVANPLPVVERQPGMSVYAQMLRLTSEGGLAIGGPDPDAPLDIRPNWLTTEHDRSLAVAMLKYIRAYLARPALADILGEEVLPGADVQSDEDILDMVYRSATCGTHAVGTCRMGRDENAVLDERLRVRGVEGLRVVDCSAMPALVSGNTNGPAMALGWRASDLILEDARLRNAA